MKFRDFLNLFYLQVEIFQLYKATLGSKQILDTAITKVAVWFSVYIYKQYFYSFIIQVTWLLKVH